MKDRLLPNPTTGPKLIMLNALGVDSGYRRPPSCKRVCEICLPIGYWSRLKAFYVGFVF